MPVWTCIAPRASRQPSQRPGPQRGPASPTAGSQTRNPQAGPHAPHARTGMACVARRTGHAASAPSPGASAARRARSRRPPQPRTPSQGRRRRSRRRRSSVAAECVEQNALAQLEVAQVDRAQRAVQPRPSAQPRAWRAARGLGWLPSAGPRPKRQPRRSAEATRISRAGAPARYERPVGAAHRFDKRGLVQQRPKSAETLGQQWNVCHRAQAMTANTWAMYSAGTSSWNRSARLFTKMRLGLRHFTGCMSRSGQQVDAPRPVRAILAAGCQPGERLSHCGVRAPACGWWPE